ncbi:MAG: DUF4397 domain-containing protein [Candidatus Cloacimonetes bacterium]|nr:DUF4397 domain-containing protein [Candidatus Cloacimonadota bacterium]
MRRVMLFLLSLIILIIAAVSIYKNYSRKEIQVRIINLISNKQNLSFTINDFTVPYDIAYGTSSEYFSLSNREVSLNLFVQEGSDNELINTDITLSGDCFNTVILYNDEEKLDYLYLTSPKVTNKQQTAIRYLPVPTLIEDIEVSLSKDDYHFTFSTEEADITSYQTLPEGFYTISIVKAEIESIYTAFLENNELYTLVILQSNEYPYNIIRIFIDNYPGDQFITPIKNRYSI